MPAGIDKFWMQPNNVSPISPQAEDGGWSSVIVGDLTGISANTTYRFWYSYEGNAGATNSYLTVSIGSGGQTKLFAGEDADANEGPEGNKHHAYYKYVECTSGTTNLTNLYIKSSENVQWTGTLLMVAVTTTAYSSGSGMIDAINNNCKNDNPYLFTSNYSHTPESQYNKMHGNNANIIDGWSLWGNWKYVPVPHNAILTGQYMGGEAADGEMRALDWDLETSDFPAGEYTGSTGDSSYSALGVRSHGMSMLNASMFGAHSPSGMRMGNWDDKTNMSKKIKSNITNEENVEDLKNSLKETKESISRSFNELIQIVENTVKDDEIKEDALNLVNKLKNELSNIVDVAKEKVSETINFSVSEEE